LDAVDLLSEKGDSWTGNCLVYIDPPYFKKGHYLYHDAYGPKDHADIASAVASLANVNWLVSYDDVRPIHDLYQNAPWLQYTLNYSARNAGRGREAMFFSKDLQVPAVPKPLMELDRDLGHEIRPVNQRQFAA
jgi:DNA adenine methylase